MGAVASPTVRLIPVEHIQVLNPRVRNRRIFEEIVANISHLGLKRPITVSQRKTPQGETRYDLVCGQGRLEAYQALGQAKIPAIIVEASQAECMMMSLVENCARRPHVPVELVQDIARMKKRGYTAAQIAKKTDLTEHYVRAVVRLLQNGEIRLITAMEKGVVPLSIAMLIAEENDQEVQKALREAYQNNTLRGRRLAAVKRLIEQRKRLGKKQYEQRYTRGKRPMTSHALVRAYQQEVDRQRLLVRKSELTQSKFIFIVEAMKSLLTDDHFVALLRAENLATMPRSLADRMSKEQVVS